MARTGRPRLENPRKEGIFVRLTSEEHAEMKEYAERNNLTITQMIVKGFEELKAKENDGDI